MSSRPPFAEGFGAGEIFMPEDFSPSHYARGRNDTLQHPTPHSLHPLHASETTVRRGLPFLQYTAQGFLC